MDYFLNNGTTSNFTTSVGDGNFTVTLKDEIDRDTVIILAAVFGTLGAIICIIGGWYMYKYFKARKATHPSVRPHRTTTGCATQNVSVCFLWACLSVSLGHRHDRRTTERKTRKTLLRLPQLFMLLSFGSLSLKSIFSLSLSLEEEEEEWTVSVYGCMSHCL